MSAESELRDEIERLRAVVVRVSQADDVASAYQRVYFEDERSWKEERSKRIAAESALEAERELSTRLYEALEALRPCAQNWLAEVVGSPAEEVVTADLQQANAALAAFREAREEDTQ